MNETVEYQRTREFMRLVCDELNVKRFHASMLKTDKGNLDLVYFSDEDDLFVEHAGERVEAPVTLQAYCQDFLQSLKRLRTH